MTQTPVLRPAIVETTALGAAYLAGLHVKAFASKADIQKAWACETRFTPKMPRDQQQKLYTGWQHAVKQVLA